VKKGVIIENFILVIFCVHVFIAMLANAELYLLYETGDTMKSYPYANFQHFPEAMRLLFIGYNVILCGLETTKNHALPKLIFNIPEKRLKQWYWVNLILIIQGYFFPFRIVGTFNYLITMIPLISILYFVRLGYQYQQKQIITWAYTLLLSTLFVRITQSYLRFEMIAPILVYTFGMYMGAGSLKPLKSVRYLPLLTFGILFIIYFEAIGISRSETTYSGSGNVVNKLEYISKAKVDDDEARLNAFQRTSSIAQLSACVDLVGKNNFYDGELLAFMGTALIPRFLWPDKPKIALGTWFAYNIGAAVEHDGAYNNSINMTVIGNLYLDFGYWGIIIGCFLVGIILQQFWYSSDFYSNGRNYTGTMLGGFLLLTTLFGIGADLQIIVTILGFYLVLFVFNFIFKE
jgi:hypothetical protein